MDELEQAEAPKSAAMQAARYSSKFKSFIRELKLPDDIETMAISKLCLYLRYFYREVRADDGSLLSTATLGCIRAGINRYLRLPPVNRAVDLLKGEEY